MKKTCRVCNYPEDSRGHEVSCLGTVAPSPPVREVFAEMRRHLVDARDQVFDAGITLEKASPGYTLDYGEREELLKMADQIRDLGAALVIDTARLRDEIRQGRITRGRQGRLLRGA